MTAIILQGIACLDYLASRHVVVVEEGDNPPNFEREWIEPVPNVFDEAFFDMVGEAYATHLYALRDAYGVGKKHQDTERTKYDDAFKEYSQQLSAGILAWVKLRADKVREDHLIDNAADVVEVLSTMHSRLEYVMAHKPFNSTKFGLQLFTHTPIMCSFFLVDQADFLVLHKFAIFEIIRTLEPLFCNILQDSKGHAFSKFNPTAILLSWIERQDPRFEAQTVLNGVSPRLGSHLPICFSTSFSCATALRSSA
jgi:hypothetical protein